MKKRKPEAEDLLAEACLLGLTGGFRMAFEYALAAAVALYLIFAITFLNDPDYEHASLLRDPGQLVFIPLVYLLYGYWIFVPLFPPGSTLPFIMLGAATAIVMALPLRGSRPWSRRQMRRLPLVMTLVVIASLAAAAYTLRPAPWALIIFFILPGMAYAVLTRRLLHAILALVEEMSAA